MTINTWLCKHFDNPTGFYDDSTIDNPHPITPKGYVTIWDIVSSDTITKPLFYILVSWWALWITGAVVSIILNLPYISTPLQSSDNIVYSILFKPIVEGWYVILKYTGVPTAIIIITLYSLYKISQIKIVKCPLKDNKK